MTVGSSICGSWRLLLIVCYLHPSVAVWQFKLSSSPPCEGNITVDPRTLQVQQNHTDHFRVTLCQEQSSDVLINFHSSNETLVSVQQNVTINASDVNTAYHIELQGLAIGKVHVNMTSEGFNLSQEFVNIEVVKSDVLTIIALVIGWIYFAAWSISFYPQVYLNFKRKSVVGLSFDFLSYNFTGFLVYGVYNCSLYWSQYLQDQYEVRHQYSLVPVQLNDVVFTIHAFFITSVTIVQCFIYERGSQKLSVVCWVLQSLGWVFIAIILIITVLSKGSHPRLSWLDFVTYISFIKLGVTLIKYIPQVFMNYRRKSTDGWSIGNVLLDFTGGTFSILQMILLSYNGDDWSSFFGDPTKFGLGFFSIVFDIIFILQHYVWYREQGEHEPLINNDTTEEDDHKG